MDSALRILQIGKFTPDNFGGIEYATQLFHETLEKLGHTVSTIAFSNNSTKSFPGWISLPNWGVLAGQPVGSLSINSLLPWQPELVIAHTPNFLALQWLQKIQAPCWLYAHSNPSTPWKRHLWKWALENRCRSVEKILISSERNKKIIDLPDHLKSKVDILPFAIPVQSGQVMRSQVDTSSVQLLFLGRHVEYKNIFFLKKVIEQTNSILNIAGAGPKSEQLQKHFSSLIQKGKVIWHGRVDDGAKKKLFMNCDIFLTPSLSPSESFCLAAGEAMSYGLPVVAFHLDTGICDLVVHEKTGLLAPVANERDFIASVSRLIGNPDLRLSLGKEAAYHIESNFSKILFSQRLSQILSKTMIFSPQQEISRALSPN